MNKYKIAATYILLILTIVLIIFVIPNFFRESSRQVTLIIWIIIFNVSLYIDTPKIRIKNIVDRTKTIIIIIMLHYIVYLLLGLIYGYSRSPYSHSIVGIANNILFIYAISIFQEYVRSKLLGVTKQSFVQVIITILFIFLKLNYINVSTNFISPETIFKYFSTVIFIETMNSILLTYLSINGGYLLNFSYTIPIGLVTILLPIFPNVDWFIEVILKFILLYLIYIFIDYEGTKKSSRVYRNVERQNPYKMLLFIFIVLIIVAFIIGLFPYKPIAIMSNSMYPTFNRGYMLIIQKVNANKINDIKIGDIIEYKFNENIVVHRVINIYINEYWEKIYITKGDHNISPDAKVVRVNQISGLIKFKIPYLGYPAVLLTEKIFNQTIR